MLFRASPAFLTTLLVASICSTSAGRISSTVKQQQKLLQNPETPGLNVNLYTGPDTNSDYLTTIQFNQNPIIKHECIDLADGIKAVAAVHPNSKDTGYCFAFPNASCKGYGKGFFNPGNSNGSPLIAPDGVYYRSIDCIWPGFLPSVTGWEDGKMASI